MPHPPLTARPAPDYLRLAEALGAVVAAEATVSGGYTAATRLRLTLCDGRTLFAKIATSDETEGWLQQEWRVYQHLRGAFMPQALAFVPMEDGFHALLVEDLSRCAWPPPWSDGRVQQVLLTLDAVHASRFSPDVPRLRDDTTLTHAWEHIARAAAHWDEQCWAPQSWFTRNAAQVATLDAVAALDGDALLHADVRSDNLCFRGDQCVLFDWSSACRGNPRADLAAWMPSLIAEGGRLPEDIIAACLPQIVVLAGYFLRQAVQPAPAHAPTLRDFQRQQGLTLLPWVERWLDQRQANR
ncbi:MAG: aminoglycoside phosphotransferase family protein [Burkholderiales bacterium]|nr:aminoglycoside phosphotransferase family protein [Burkholderiales bacterium]